MASTNIHPSIYGGSVEVSVLDTKAKVETDILKFYEDKNEVVIFLSPKHLKTVEVAIREFIKNKRKVGLNLKAVEHEVE
jgi:hypothetical protein